MVILVATLVDLVCGGLESLNHILCSQLIMYITSLDTNRHPKMLYCSPLKISDDRLCDDFCSVCVTTEILAGPTTLAGEERVRLSPTPSDISHWYWCCGRLGATTLDKSLYEP